MISARMVMILFIIASLIYILQGCGTKVYTKRSAVKKATPTCTVSSLENGAVITCPDGSSTVIQHGLPGKDGDDGQAGTNGTGCTLEDTETGAIITCGDRVVVLTDGEDGEPGADGEPGKDGAPGQDGEPGEDGKDCVPKKRGKGK